jgi:hypothetical protein
MWIFQGYDKSGNKIWQFDPWPQSPTDFLNEIIKVEKPQ